MSRAILRPRSLLLAHTDPPKRIVIAGGPKTGKTQLATRYGAPYRIRHSDSVAFTHDWSAASAEVARWMSEPGPWVLEGTATVRALRKWLANHPIGRPCDVVVWLEQPFRELRGGQRSMAKACDTVWREVLPKILRRGVSIERPRPIGFEQDFGADGA